MHSVLKTNHARLLQSALLATSILLTACGGGNTLLSTNAAPAAEITSAGTDFYLTLPDHLCVSTPSLCNNAPVINKMILTAASATSGTVTFNGVATPFTVSAGGEAVVTLDPAVVLTSNEKIEAKGIHVTAQLPVSVHVISEVATSADGYLALPTQGLGTHYYVMSYASSRYAGSEFAMVATQHATTISITPSASGLSRPAGVAYTVSLNAGGTYQLTNPGNADMTGTLITADKPIAVFGGHRCADIPSGIGYCDYLVEQLPDTSVWGNTFHTSLFSGRAHYTVRVMASQDGTTFATMPAGLIGTLNAGQFADVTLSGSGEIVSSNPVLVAQFIRGYADDSAAKGDPSMVLVTPAEMGMTDATFGVDVLSGSTGSFINVVAETAALPNLKLDGAVVDAALFSPMGGTSIYSTGTIPVVAGSHSLTGSGPFSALVYDFGLSWNAVSYAYPVATRLSLPATSTLPSPGTPVSGCGDTQQDQDNEEGDSYQHEVDQAGETRDTNQYGHESDDDSNKCS